MEVDSEFNAGYGGVLTREEEVEMDACLMDGKTMNVGAVTGVQNIYHPISLARKVMEKTQYNFLGAKGAMKLAQEEKFNFLKPGMLVTDNAKASLERWRNATGIGRFDVSEIKLIILNFKQHNFFRKETLSAQLRLMLKETLQLELQRED